MRDTEKDGTNVKRENTMLDLISNVKKNARRVIPTRIWGRLRMLRLRHTVRTYRERTVTHRYGGLRLSVVIADPLAEGWYDHDWPELDEIAFLKRHKLIKGAVAFDIGAHQGVVALMLSDAVGPTGKVVAVEALPHNARMACRNRDLNGASQLVVEAAAVSDQCGELRFNEGLNGQVEDGSGAWGEVRVPALTVDELARRHGRPDVLFIDVEGYELSALRGAGQTFRSKPDCFIEMHVGVGLEKFGGSTGEIVTLLGDGYDLFMSNDEQRTPVPYKEGHPLVAKRFFLTAIARA
jgi:FkbM family methyltransferase